MKRRPVLASYRVPLAACLPVFCLLGLMLLQGIAIAAAPPKPDDLRELLSLYGLDDQRLAQFVDGEPLGSKEQEPLLRALVAVRRLKFDEIHAASRPEFPPASVLGDTKPQRGEFFAFEGRVRRMTIERPADEVANRFQLDHYYRCEIDSAGGQPAVVYALTVPESWKPGKALDARVGVQGLLLKRSGTADEPTAIFAAARIAWYPVTALGILQMDVGLLDTVRDREALTASERECFYALLAAAKRSPPGKLLGEASRDPIAPLFNEPAAQRGRLVAIRGTAIRAIPVHVEEPDIVTTFGIDHYFEVEVVNQDSHGNAMAFCVLELPPGMPTGDHIAVDVQGAGFFLKSWAYRPHPLANKDQPTGQIKVRLAPMIIGRELALQVAPEPTHEVVNVISLLLLTLAIGGLVLFVWRIRREDRHMRRPTPVGPIGPPSDDVGE